ncbi:hypothetical protein [Desulfobulbus oligotrophicus]|nr:hypothetical protein [Desulfobulbus oligotrophicus]
MQRHEPECQSMVSRFSAMVKQQAVAKELELSPLLLLWSIA